MEINLQEFYKNYKEIWKTCMFEGYLIPYYFSHLARNVPVEYRFSLKEQEKILNRIPSDTQLKLVEMNMSRRQKEREIFNKSEGDNEFLMNMQAFEENEVSLFFDKFPQFKFLMNVY